MVAYRFSELNRTFQARYIYNISLQFLALDSVFTGVKQ